jgi:hypothetical protein
VIVFKWETCPEKFSEIFMRAVTLEKKSLNLCSQDLYDIDVPYIVAFLNEYTKILALKIADNFISSAGAKALANTTLLALDLSENYIDDAGGETLANNTTLKTLDISSNLLFDASAKAFANNTTLMALNLSCNLITDAGAKTLARNMTLTALDIRYTKISVVGAEALFLCLKKRTFQFLYHKLTFYYHKLAFQMQPKLTANSPDPKCPAMDVVRTDINMVSKIFEYLQRPSLNLIHTFSSDIMKVSSFAGSPSFDREEDICLLTSPSLPTLFVFWATKIASRTLEIEEVKEEYEDIEIKQRAESMVKHEPAVNQDTEMQRIVAQLLACNAALSHPKMDVPDCNGRGLVLQFSGSSSSTTSTTSNVLENNDIPPVKDTEKQGKGTGIDF